MNLGKLLGAGKSIFSTKGPVKYRESKQVYLPKFNAEKNPFAPRQDEPAPVAPVEKSLISAPAAAPMPKGNLPVAAVRATRAVSWKDKLNPFRAPEPAAQPMVGAVQAELSLESVKVIHNDLMDAEIEVVPVKSQTVSVSEPPILPPSRRHWKTFEERLVNAD
jgi:hypothetical protein